MLGRMSPQALTLSERVSQFEDFIESRQDAIAAVLQQKVDPDSFLSVVRSSVSRNPDLLACTPMSLYGCIYDAAKLGLDLDPRCGEFWLIPRNNKNLARGQKECTGMIGYKGFVTSAMRSGAAKHVHARCVYQQELEDGLFSLDQATGDVRHEYRFDVSRADDEIVGAYAAITLHDGTRHVEPLTLAEIKKRRRVGQSGGGIWDQWFPEMVRKTAIRAAFGRGVIPLNAVVNSPRAITIHTPEMRLADLEETEQRYEAEREVPTVTVEAEQPAPNEPVAVEEGAVYVEPPAATEKKKPDPEPEPELLKPKPKPDPTPPKKEEPKK